jgi:hypothetical protein
MVKLLLYYTEDLTIAEQKILEKFRPVIVDNWIKHSCCISSLEWTVSQEDIGTKSMRVATLRTRHDKIVIHMESLCSLAKKSLEAFEREFIDDAAEFRRNQP